MTIRALTICQPYAELIVSGEKRVENRVWHTSHRGPLLIHAGASRDWLDTYRHLPDSMDFSAIVGIVELTHVVPFQPGRNPRPPRGFEWLAEDPHAEGPRCWILANARRFKRPIESAGAQGLWYPKPEVMQQIEAQLALLRAKPGEGEHGGR